MITDQNYIANIAVLADTLKVSIEARMTDGYMEGSGSVKIPIDKGHVIDVEFKIIQGYRFLNDNAGVLLELQGWEYNLFSYTGNGNVYVVLIPKGVKLPDYNMRSFVDLSKIHGIMGACSRRIENAVWVPIKQVGHQQL